MVAYKMQILTLVLSALAFNVCDAQLVRANTSPSDEFCGLGYLTGHLRVFGASSTKQHTSRRFLVYLGPAPAAVDLSP